MAYNGSGLFVIDSTGQPVSASTLIQSSVFNALTADLGTGLSTAITKDGQTTITANLPMAGYRHTGVGNASARTMYAAAGQVQDGSLCYGTVGGTADAITLTLTPAITAYAAGQKFSFIASGANTTAVTINVNSVGAKDVTKHGTTALAAGEIASGMVCVVEYDGTRFQLVNVKSAAIGANTFTGLQTFAAGADIASAATVDLTAATGNLVRITGTTATTGVTINNGQVVLCYPTGDWPLTYHATNMPIKGGASVTVAAGGTVIFSKDGNGTLHVDIFKADGTALVVAPVTVQLTAQATTSGAYKDFTIPSGVNRIALFFVGFSTNGTNVPLIQLGDSGGIENTGYTGAATITTAGATAAAAHSGGFYLASSWAASAALSGAIFLEHYGGNYWMISGTLSRDEVAATHSVGGWKSLTTEITTIRFTSVGASDTLDAGAVNVSYQK